MTCFPKCNSFLAPLTSLATVMSHRLSGQVGSLPGCSPLTLCPGVWSSDTVLHSVTPQSDGEAGASLPKSSSQSRTPSCPFSTGIFKVQLQRHLFPWQTPPHQQASQNFSELLTQLSDPQKSPRLNYSLIVFDSYCFSLVFFIHCPGGSSRGRTEDEEHTVHALKDLRV